MSGCPADTGKKQADKNETEEFKSILMILFTRQITGKPSLKLASGKEVSHGYL